ncbi:PURPLE ACID PHOSPHATASE [Salix koriyanagi]|uniref:acid phosphatase n=1 Tax=Salix koriyanagi TaxID=2511006 RepID=A0A9Q0WS17_9ROSI|nr:PURPLE ACID PHOSPHATASE [Salix koriyanagi]
MHWCGNIILHVFSYFEFCRARKARTPQLKVTDHLAFWWLEIGGEEASTTSLMLLFRSELNLSVSLSWPCSYGLYLPGFVVAPMIANGSNVVSRKLNIQIMGKIGEKLDIDFVVSTGDNFYDNGLTGLNDQAFEESFTKIYTATSLQKQWYSVLGNHDYRGDVAAQVHPALRKVDSRWLCLRSFILNTEIAGLFFVDTTPFVIDYFTDMDHTYDWRGVTPRKAYLDSLIKDLESALSESTARWKIVVGHHAIKSAGYHGDTKELNDLLLPMLKAYNVDMYVNGHDHCLEHISSLDSPIQYLTSGAGSKAWRGDLNQNYKEDDLKFFYDGQGFMAVQLTNNDAEITFYNAFGKILHEWKALKELHSAV